MRKPVKFVKFHGADQFLPVVGQIGTTLPPNNKTIPGLQMYLDSEFPGVIVVKADAFEGFVPLANCQIGLFGPDTSPTKSPAAVKVVPKAATETQAVKAS